MNSKKRKYKTVPEKQLKLHQNEHEQDIPVLVYLNEKSGEGLLGMVDLNHVPGPNIGEILISKFRKRCLFQIIN